MKVEAAPTDDHQMKLTVEVDADQFEDYKRRAARVLAKKTKIPGFRPGKAPYNVVVRHISESAILDEAIEILVEDIYPKAIEQAEIEVYGPGSLEKIQGLEPPVFEFLVPLRSEVTLGDYRSVRVDYEPDTISEQDVLDVLHNLQEQQAIIEVADRKAHAGDLVNIQISGKLTIQEDGDNSMLVPQRNFEAIIKSVDADNSDQWPFPGFSQGLVGLQAGDERNFTYTYPDDYEYESLRSKDVQYEVKILDVRSRTLPELNDEFAQSVGEYTTYEELRSEVENGLTLDAQDKYNEGYEDQVLEKIAEMSTIKYPPQMLEKELDFVIDNLENRLQERGLDIDLYLKTRQIDMDALREETKPVAESRLRRSLLYLELSEAEKIKVDPKELEQETQKTMDAISKILPDKDLRKLTRQENTFNVVGNIMMDMIIDKTRRRILDIARGLETDSQSESVSELEHTAQDHLETEEVETPAD